MLMECFSVRNANSNASFLAKKIQTSEMDFELCYNSIAYLNFEDFSLNSTETSLKDSLMLGRYSFHDYAVVCWVLHLESWLSGGTPAESSVSALAETLGVFLDRHYSDGTRKIKVS